MDKWKGRDDQGVSWDGNACLQIEHRLLADADNALVRVQQIVDETLPALRYQEAPPYSNNSFLLPAGHRSQPLP